MEEVTLYKKSSKTGKIQLWAVKVEMAEDGVSAFLIRKSGFVGNKEKVVHKLIDKGTNIGKANEKTPYELAVFKANKLITEHYEDNYHYSIDDVDKPIEFIKPMLAEPFDIAKVVFPCFAQPKMNGVRCFSLRHLDDHTMWSRERREYSAIKEIKAAVGKYFKLNSPDGEIYDPDLTFQEIISAVKKRSENTKILKMWVYDLAIPDLPFEERNAIIKDIFETNKDNGILDYFFEVPTVVVNSFEELDALHDQWVLEGFEGLILRTPSGVYEFNERTFSLIKYKKFVDEEFEIVGFECEVWHDVLNDKFRELVIWKCITKDGALFDVRPAGSFLLREKAYKTASSQIGKLYTVKFQNYSDDGVPIFPVGVAIRDYE